MKARGAGTHAEGQRFTRPELKSVFGAATVRLAAAPIVALCGIVTTGILVRSTDAIQFGIISLVATSVALIPFADLGYGAAVTTAASRVGASTEANVAFEFTLAAACRRLLIVSAVLLLLSGIAAAVSAWGVLLGVELTQSENWLVSLVLGLFAVSVPLSLGSRVLIGLGRNTVASLVGPSASVLTLVSTLAAWASEVPPMVYATTPVFGLMIANVWAAWLALRVLRTHGVRLKFRLRTCEASVLAGSFAMLVIMISQPATFQSGRLILSHRGTPVDLSAYSLTMQLYGSGAAVVAVAGAALWPIFVRRRGGADQTLALWWRSLGAAVVVGICGAAVFVCVAPGLCSLISGEQIEPSRGLAMSFGVLFLMQTIHLPTGMMLTSPRELAWQAKLTVCVAISSVALSFWLVPAFGAQAVAWSAAASIGVFQVVPGVLFGGRIVRSRATGTAHGVGIPQDR